MGSTWDSALSPFISLSRSLKNELMPSKILVVVSEPTKSQLNLVWSSVLWYLIVPMIFLSLFWCGSESLSKNDGLRSSSKRLKYTKYSFSEEASIALCARCPNILSIGVPYTRGSIWLIRRCLWAIHSCLGTVGNSCFNAWCKPFLPSDTKKTLVVWGLRYDFTRKRNAYHVV